MDLTKIKLSEMTDEQLDEYFERTSISPNEAHSAWKHLRTNAERFLRNNALKKQGIKLEPHEETMYKRYIRNYYIWKYYQMYAHKNWEADSKRMQSEVSITTGSTLKNNEDLTIKRLLRKEVKETIENQKDDYLRRNPEKAKQYEEWYKKQPK